MAIPIENIPDFLEATIQDIFRNEYIDISYADRRYPAMSKIIQPKKIVRRGSSTVRWEVKVSAANQARDTAPYAVDPDVTSTDFLQRATLPWSWQDVPYQFDAREEVWMEDADVIVDYVKMKYFDAQFDLFKLLEGHFWGRPADNSTAAELLKPYGVQYWFPFATAAVTDNTFNGTVPATGGFTTIAGLSPTVYANWRCYNNLYTEVSDDDLMDKLRDAVEYTDFMSPVPHLDAAQKKPDYGFFTGFPQVKAIEKLLKLQNDQLGFDSHPTATKAMTMGHAWTTVPQLEASTAQSAIYGINFAQFQIWCKKGWYMRPSKKHTASNSHNVIQKWIDNSIQFACKDRRTGGFVINKAA